MMHEDTLRKKILNKLMIGLILLLIIAFVGVIIQSSTLTLISVCIGMCMVLFIDRTDYALRQVERYIDLRVLILNGRDIGYNLEELEYGLTRYQKFLYEKVYKR